MSDKPEPPLPESEKQRVVRVFISSTFRDMHAERDELVKFVFPELRRKCRERQVAFVAVDLRWGIPDEKRSEILPICLKEIDRCLPHDPYFVGILGERYGSLSETINEDMAKDLPWLWEHKEHSITALEIIHGVLKRPEMKSHAFFYFRDPAYIESIPPEKRKDFTAEDAKGAEKLIKLKDRIRKSGQAVRENYPNPKALGALVLEDLWAVIDRRFPKEEVPSDLERERMDHTAYANARIKLYIERKEYFYTLDMQAQSNNPPLALLGDSGAGKSALIANWVRRYSEAHPGDFVITHFIGGTADSADYVSILRRIMGEIKSREDEKLGKKGIGKGDEDALLGSIGKEQDEIPTDPEKVVDAFPLWLARAAAMGRCIIILDALNQLEDRDNAPDLGWLPEFFPENIRVILSTLPGRCLDAVTKRGWKTMKVQPLEMDERKEFIKHYLAQYGQELSEERIVRITAERQSANPLYLKTLLDELRVFGIYEKLDEKIDYYLTAKTADDLYELMLERLENDYERDCEGLVRKVMTLIWASRRGLSENEIKELLGSRDNPLPHAYWSPLYLAIEESLVSRSGLLTFFHDYLKKAVEDKYLSKAVGDKYLRDTKSEHEAHLQIADYFDKRETDDRKADELPWQLRQAEKWERLKDCITDIPMFMKLMTDATQYELMGYWMALGNRFDMVASYNTAISRWEQTSPYYDKLSFTLDRVACFLDLNARYDDAEPLCRRALAIREKVLGQEHPDTATSLHNLAGLLHHKDDIALTKLLCSMALAIYEKVLGRGRQDTATTLGSLASVLDGKVDYAVAEMLCRRALAIREKVLGQGHPDTATSLHMLAGLLNDKRSAARADPVYRMTLAIYEKVLGRGRQDTATTLGSLASVLDGKGDYAVAEMLCRRALAIYEKALGQEHPHTATSLHMLGCVLDSKRDYKGAEMLLRKALAITEKALGRNHSDTATILHDLAVLLHFNKGDYEDAEPLLRRALAIYEKTLGIKHLYTFQCRFYLKMFLFLKIVSWPIRFLRNIFRNHKINQLEE